jgi:hypothetical protein
MANGAPKPESTAASYAFLTRAAWKDRDKILAELRLLGASAEDIKQRVGPEPPRIDYKLLDQPLKLEPFEQWSEEWAQRADVAYQEYRDRQRATSRQAYRSFMGEDPAEPKNRRSTDSDQLPKVRRQNKITV